MLLLGLLAGCPDRSIAEVLPESVGEDRKEIPVGIQRDIDILFLVDKSPTMEDLQRSLADNFPRFMEVLEGIEGGLPNVHIGVISQDIGAAGTSNGFCRGEGDSGELLSIPRVAGCNPPDDNFIVDIARADGTRERNYTDSLGDTFRCIAQLGPDGCGFEQHLESLRLALDGSRPGNDGFIRDDAYLAIVIISDEDDCSAKDGTIFSPTPASVDDPLGPVSDFRCGDFGWLCDGGRLRREPSEYEQCVPWEDSPYLEYPQVYVDFIKSLKADPRQIIVAGIIGDQTPIQVDVTGQGIPDILPSCTVGDRTAHPMPRIKYFTDQFVDRNVTVSICDADLSPGLLLIAELLKKVLVNPCIEADVATVDLSPAPGLQIDCTVASVVGDPVQETAVPSCRMADEQTPAADSPVPCWYVVRDEVQCAEYPSQLILNIHPEGYEFPPETRMVSRCLVSH